ncbi:hypothetical protein KP509_33G053300 [Ceratopteris richardii]|uniref:Uncharacterized protein n=1 Tax=Ceratopteris richardii TaxID=49495 RepID=A0A8T2QPR7_CERRI|nr:hypothetical protein KP509_33G053300 [Ceratopteris richardii]
MTVNVPDQDFYRTVRETQVHTVVKDLCKHSAACIRKLAKGLACAWGARILQNIRERSSSSTMETSSLADNDEESPPGKRFNQSECERPAEKVSMQKQNEDNTPTSKRFNQCECERPAEKTQNDNRPDNSSSCVRSKPVLLANKPVPTCCCCCCTRNNKPVAGPSWLATTANKHFPATSPCWPGHRNSALPSENLKLGKDHVKGMQASRRSNSISCRSIARS